MQPLPGPEGVAVDVGLRFCQQVGLRSDDPADGGGLLVQRVHVFKLRELWTMMAETIRIGTRGSALALWQANWVKSALEAAHPALTAAIFIIKTRGDKILDVPLAKVGGKGLFVKEIEEALLAGEVDLAVHSMKDMPGLVPAGLCIGPVPQREDASDVLVSGRNLKLAQLRRHAVVGTSSLRRAAQLKKARPDLRIVPLRGNLDTRLRKLHTDGLDAVVLAAAGIRRLGMAEQISEHLDFDIMLPAVAQGALCLEMRQSDRSVASATAFLNHAPSRQAVMAERAFLARLGGSCQIPVAGHGLVQGRQLVLHGLIADLDGTTVIRSQLEGNALDGEKIGRDLADALLDRGGRQILDQLPGP
jgi:hydroxymethylbilane synthase